MAAPIKIAIIGATGRTGKAIVEGLLTSPINFEVTSLTRGSSLQNAANLSFKEKGVKIMAFDILGPKADLVQALDHIDVLISCIHWTRLEDQIPLIAAAKEAGIKRFVPCSFGTSAPRGVMELHDRKEVIFDAIQRAYLPYTEIEVGWWYQNIVPPVPSGRTDHAVIEYVSGQIPGDGNVPSAITDVDDIGAYVARIVADPRTLNRRVFAYSEVLTMNQVWDLMAELSREELKKEYVTAEEIQETIIGLNKKLEENPEDGMAMGSKALYEYFVSWAVRGDNTPEAAVYLGYLDFKTLFPDVKGKSLREYFSDVLEKKAGQRELK